MLKHKNVKKNIFDTDSDLFLVLIFSEPLGTVRGYINHVTAVVFYTLAYVIHTPVARALTKNRAGDSN